MNSTFAFGFDDSLLRKFLELQQQINAAVPQNLLRSFQQELKIYNQLHLDGSLQATKILSKNIQSGCLPQLTSELLVAQQVAAQLTPITQKLLDEQRVASKLTSITQKLLDEQRWIQSVIPNLSISLNELLSPSCISLSRDSAMGTDVEEITSCLNKDISKEEIAAEVSTLTPEEERELATNISGALQDTLNWQQRLMSVLLKWKERNPIIAFLVALLISNIIWNLFINAVSWTAKTVKASVIRNEPTSSAIETCRIQQAQHVIVIGDVPYYYFIEFNDPNTNAPQRGYISKKSVQAISESETP